MKQLYKEPEMDIEIVEAEEVIVTSSPKIEEADGGQWGDPETSFSDFMKP